MLYFKVQDGKLKRVQPESNTMKSSGDIATIVVKLSDSLLLEYFKDGSGLITSQTNPDSPVRLVGLNPTDLNLLARYFQCELS